MPTYDYECTDCGHAHEVTKRISDLDTVEHCPKCNGDNTKRYIVRTHFYGAGDWNKLEWNPGLGQWVEGGAKARTKIAREKGLTEVGNECPDRYGKHQDDKLNTILEDNWSKA